LSFRNKMRIKQAKHRFFKQYRLLREKLCTERTTFCWET